jgi:hypothetical protein
VNSIELLLLLGSLTGYSVVAAGRFESPPPIIVAVNVAVNMMGAALDGDERDLNVQVSIIHLH